MDATQRRAPNSTGGKRPRTLPGGICLGHESLGGFLRLRPAGSPALGEVFSFPQTPESWETQRRAGSSVEPRPLPPTGSRGKSAKLSPPTSERLRAYHARRTQPPVRAEVTRRRKSDGHLGTGKGKTPQQLPPNWHSKRERLPSAEMN